MKAHLSILRIAHWRASLARLSSVWVAGPPSLPPFGDIENVAWNLGDDRSRVLRKFT